MKDAWADELAFAIALAEKAGAAVIAVRKTAKVKTKAGGEPVTEADLAANDIIVAGLAGRFPRDGLLSEETADTDARFDKERVWIIDPIDGTKEFIAGTDDFAVQIALASKGRVVVGVVYQVAKRRMFHARQGGGAHLTDTSVKSRDTRPLKVSHNANADAMRMTVSRFHRSRKLVALQEALKPKELVPAGGVGIKMSLVAKGSVDCYLHPSRAVKEWDSAAPHVIVEEAGGIVSDLFGGPLTYNKRDPVHPNGIAATNGAAHDPVLAKVHGALARVDFTAV